MGTPIPRMKYDPTDTGRRFFSGSMVPADADLPAYRDADGTARSMWPETCFPVARRTGTPDIYGTACAYINALLMAFRYGLPGHPQHEIRRHGWL